MVKCSRCGTAWTSSGLPLCPVCGSRVEQPAASSKTLTEDRRPDPVPLIHAAPSDISTLKPSNGSAVLEVPLELRTSESRIPVPALNEAPLLREASPDTSMPDPEVLRIAPAIDASASLPVEAGAKLMPAPARPMNGPLILGFLAFVPVLMLPLTLVFEDTRVLGILSFCMSGFFAPFAPIAWIAGLSAEKCRREQGFRSERRVVIGRLMGQGATLLLVAEMALALIGIAALRLSGKFPNSFWSHL